MHFAQWVEKKKMQFGKKGRLALDLINGRIKENVHSIDNAKMCNG